MTERKHAGNRPTALVLGGGGFLGSNLCEHLLEEHNVICVDNFSSGSESTIDHLLANPHFELLRHDIQEPLDFKNLAALERFQVLFTGIQYIYHFASPAAPHLFLQKPIETMMAHTLGTKRILDIALEQRAKMIYISDALVYGSLGGGRPVESTQGAVDFYPALRPYAESKRFAEMLIDAYRTTYSLDVSIVRLYATYGPGMRLDDSRFIPWLVTQALAHEELVIPASFSKGAFLYVSDAIDAIEKIIKGEGSGTYNLGHGSEYSIEEVVSKIRTLTGSRSPVTTTQNNEALYHFWMEQSLPPNIDALRDELGWFPVVLLEDGLAKTIDAMKSLRKVKALTR